MGYFLLQKRHVTFDLVKLVKALFPYLRFLSALSNDNIVKYKKWMALNIHEMKR